MSHSRASLFWGQKMAFNLKLVRNSHSLWRILYSTIRSMWGPRRFSWSSFLSNIISWIVPLRSTHFNLHPLPNLGDWFSLLVQICLSPFNNWIVWCPQVLPSSQNPDYLLFYFLLKKKEKNLSPTCYIIRLTSFHTETGILSSRNRVCILGAFSSGMQDASPWLFLHHWNPNWQ